jgi:peptide deformylase
MAVHSVLTWGDPRLKKNSEDVGAWAPELDQLVADMFETAIAEEGVGLAAPQIGFNLNLAVIDCSCGEDPAEKIVLINPEIIWESTEIQKGPEGCLSIPGIREILERPQKVRLKNRRPDGTWYELEGEALLARAFCHEIDHLRGKLFVEYFGPVKKQVIQRKYQKHFASA